ncbi:MAG: hypothetical protein U0521_24455 [Anaerolineae bacterium]
MISPLAFGAWRCGALIINWSRTALALLAARESLLFSASAWRAVALLMIALARGRRNYDADVLSWLAATNSACQDRAIAATPKQPVDGLVLFAASAIYPCRRRRRCSRRCCGCATTASSTAIIC